MGQGIFKKSGWVWDFVGMSIGLALVGVFIGNLISLAILAAYAAMGFYVEESAFLITVPIGCAIIAAAFIVHERKQVEKEANLKVALMMLVLKSHGKLTDEEVDAFYEGMRDVRLNDAESGERSYGQGYSE